MTCPIPRPYPWRVILAGWAAIDRHDLRERWGRRANALEDTGLPWWEAEMKAMEELQEELKKS